MSMVKGFFGLLACVFGRHGEREYGPWGIVLCRRCGAHLGQYGS